MRYGDREEIEKLEAENERLRAELAHRHKSWEEAEFAGQHLRIEHDRVRADLAQANEVIDSLCHNIDRYRDDLARALGALELTVSILETNGWDMPEERALLASFTVGADSPRSEYGEPSEYEEQA